MSSVIARQPQPGDLNVVSPAPSIDSICSGDPGDKIICNEQNDHSSSVELTQNKSTSSASSSSGLGSSPLDSLYSVTKCSLCSNTFDKPKVLQCFHSFCQECLEKVQEQPEALSCPQCNLETFLSPQGVASLPTDHGMVRLIEAAASGNAEAQPPTCTSCKNGEANAVAKCITCPNFLCPGCVVAHQFMHCFEGHKVSTLGEISIKEEGHHEIQELTSINKVVQEGKNLTQDIQTNLKTLETGLVRLSVHYAEAQNDIQLTYKYFLQALEERRTDLLRELEGQYVTKQKALNDYSRKAQETVDKLCQATDFVERSMRNASNSEVLEFKRQLDLRMATLSADNPELKPEEVYDFSFVFNYQAIQNSVKTAFGYIKSQPSEITSTLISGFGGKQPPISRPLGGLVMPMASGNRNMLMSSNLSNGLSCGISTASNPVEKAIGNPIEGSICGQNQLKSYPQSNQFFSTVPNLCSSNVISQVTPSNNNLFDNDFLQKRFSGPNVSSAFGPILTDQLTNPYDKYERENGRSTHGDVHSQYGFSSNNSVVGFSSNTSVVGSQLNSTLDSIMDLSGHLMAQHMFPPKSQIKRQKMIYNCKFGEFGVLEGQFTEPSGVAVNAQNDIIVADTNNHRIQIFDKEGRFKFQFGECGKRDGQLLYPNRVAVIKTSGDIIVTERSPTHQVQIYNQYGQFVRKFGANILQHPRGVCVDHRGRIIIVECKVMRVIIFDQMGNVLTKFGCSKHLEFPNGVVVNDRQEIFISDNRAHCVKVFNYEGTYLRQIGGEGITNYPIGVGMNSAGEIAIADNHNNFNLTVFSQDGHILSALESKVKHAQCFDVALMDDGSVVLASKDYRLYVYRYIQNTHMII